MGSFFDEYCKRVARVAYMNAKTEEGRLWLNPPYQQAYKFVPVIWDDDVKRYQEYTREYLGAYQHLGSCLWGRKEKMENKNKKYWTIICTHANGNMSIVENGKKYDSEYIALCDAEKFANINHGTTYTVVVALSASVVTRPAITTRLA